MQRLGLADERLKRRLLPREERRGGQRLALQRPLQLLALQHLDLVVVERLPLLRLRQQPRAAVAQRAQDGGVAGRGELAHHGDDEAHGLLGAACGA